MIKIIDGLLAVPTVNDYVSALRRAEMTELQQKLLKIQYLAPHHQIKLEDLAMTISKPVITVNAVYGKLGHKIKDLLTVDIIGEGYWQILSIGYEHDNRFYWQMRCQVAHALKELNWW